MTTAITARPIRPEQTHALRHTVLRPHQTLAEMDYDGDGLPTTLHLGAIRDKDGKVLGVVTLNLETPMPIEPAPNDCRLRGMAVAHSAQGTGVGRLLVERAIHDAAQRGAKRLWCNARVSAMGFYEKLGFITIGERFEIKHIGPHYVMFVAVK